MQKKQKLIRNCLNKNINEIIYISVDANSDRYSTSASGFEISATSAAPISIECDEKPAKKQKLSSKEFEGEEIIMGNELSDIYINKAQNLLKAQFPQLNGLNSSKAGSLNNKIQIIHYSERHHWVVATTVNCRFL